MTTPLEQMQDIEVIRLAAAYMLDDHPPSHERHHMWAAMADLLHSVAQAMQGTSEGDVPFEKDAARVARRYLEAR